MVPNTSLLDNHQLELAEELARHGYAVHGDLRCVFIQFFSFSILRLYICVCLGRAQPSSSPVTRDPWPKEKKKKMMMEVGVLIDMYARPWCWIKTPPRRNTALRRRATPPKSLAAGQQRRRSDEEIRGSDGLRDGIHGLKGRGRGYSQASRCCTADRRSWEHSSFSFFLFSFSFWFLLSWTMKSARRSRCAP